MVILADESWYTKHDGRRNLLPHCPIAANDHCPRYYLSLKLAASADALSQHLSESECHRIEALWAASDAFASDEQSAGIYLEPDGSVRGVDGFCPEVTARIFDLYCSSLRKFPDDDERVRRHRMLAEKDIPKHDLRWEWMSSQPRRYTECAEYAVYGSGVNPRSVTRSRRRSLTPSLRWKVLERDERRCVYCGRTSAESVLHIDHRVSVANGGDDSLDNLVTACSECNLGKGARNAA